MVRESTKTLKGSSSSAYASAGANGNMKAFALPGTRGNIMLASEDAPATSNERRSSIFGSHPAGIGGNNPILREGILSR